MPPKNESMATKGATAQDFAKTTVAPRLFKSQPPNLAWQTAFPKRLDVVGNINIDDSTLDPSTGKVVPTSSGMVVWLVNRGVNGIKRYGFIPAGYSTNLARLYFGETITYNSALGAPYTPGDIKISPDLTTTFSSARLFSGDLRVICDTVPIGNTALNGYFSCGTVTDTRDVAQLSNGNCFDPSDLVQTSSTSKDGLKEISCMKGIVGLVGSDVRFNYGPPNPDVCDAGINGQYTPLAITKQLGSVLNLASGATAIFSNTWVSPWNVTLSGGSQSALLQNIQVPPINLEGCLDVKVVAGFEISSANPVVSQCIVRALLQHMWAQVGPDGSIHNGDLSMKYTMSNILPVIGGPSSGAGVFLTFEDSPVMYENTTINNGNQTNSVSNRGMYLGFQLVLMIDNPTTVDFSCTIASYPGYYPQISVRARSLFCEGELGPARIIRWDGLSKDQQIKIDGVLMAQCIPQGIIAPFVQSAAMYSDSVTNLNAMTFVSELYNGPSPFRRMWTGEAYDDFMKNVFPNFNSEMVVEWAQPKLIATANSSGMFDENNAIIDKIAQGIPQQSSVAETAPKTMMRKQSAVLASENDSGTDESLDGEEEGDESSGDEEEGEDEEESEEDELPPPKRRAFKR